MPPSLLLSLPLELRIQIWTHVLTAPKGRIELIKSPDTSDPSTYQILPLPNDSGCPILLSFLRTSKKIYLETVHLIWEHNTLHASSLLDPPHKGLLPPLPPQIGLNLVSIALPIDLTFVKLLSSRLLFLHTLKTLVPLILTGHLTSITLILSSVPSKILTTKAFEKAMLYRLHPVRSILYKLYLLALQVGAHEDSPFARVKRRFVIETPVATLDPTLRPRSLVGNPVPMVREIARAWGGSLEVNGVLAFRDGEEVGEVFLVQEQVQEQDEEMGKEGKVMVKKYFFKEDVDLWLLAKVMRELDEDEDGRGIYASGSLAGLERSERRALCARYEERMRALWEVIGIRRIEEDEEGEEKVEVMAGVN